MKDSLRDGSFEPGADMYVTDDPLQDDPNGLEAVREKVEMRKKPLSMKRPGPPRKW